MINNQVILDFHKNHIIEILSQLESFNKSNCTEEQVKELSTDLLRLSVSISPGISISAISSAFVPSSSQTIRDFIIFLFKSKHISVNPLLSLEQILAYRDFEPKITISPLNEQILYENQELRTEISSLKASIDELCINFDRSFEKQLKIEDCCKSNILLIKSMINKLLLARGNYRRNDFQEFYGKSIEASQFYEASTESRTYEKTEPTKAIEYLLSCERLKVYKLLKAGNFSEETLKQIEKEIHAHYDPEKQSLSGLESSILTNFISAISTFHSQSCHKLDLLSAAIKQVQISLSDVKYSLQSKFSEELDHINSEFNLCKKYLEKVINDKDQLQDHFDELKKDKKSLEIRFVKNTLNLESQVKQKQSEINMLQESLKSLEILHAKAGFNNDDWHEKILIENLVLKGEISSLEAQGTRIKQQLGQVEEMKAKISTQEQIINELENKKKADSDSSLSLNIDHIKESIEIQELKEALRIISHRYEKDKGILLRDCEASRQDMEAQIFRLKQEKAYCDTVNKDLQKHLVEVCGEKENLERDLGKMYQYLEKHKECRTPRSENEFASSLEFDLTKSIDIPNKSNTLPQKTIQDAIIEELNEISMIIKKKHSVDMNTITIFEIIKNTLSHMMKIQEVIEVETSSNSQFKMITQNMSDAFYKLKSMIKNIQDESLILNKKIDFPGSERLFTDPSGRISERENSELISYYKKQLQIERAKVLEKKHVIKLHKEQISFLKQNLRDLQEEASRSKPVDFEYSREVFKRFMRDVPILQESSENTLDLLGKILSIPSSEMNIIKEDRKSKKSRPLLRSIFS